MTEQERNTKLQEILMSDDPLEYVNWDVDYKVIDSEQALGNGFVIDAADWKQALTYAGPSIEEMLVNGGIYHLRIADILNVLVGISFSFMVEDDQILAIGSCHPAVKSLSGDYHTITDEVITQRKILITPKDPLSALAIKVFINEYL